MGVEARVPRLYGDRGDRQPGLPPAPPPPAPELLLSSLPLRFTSMTCATSRQPRL
jgi:hypothetical protein